MSEIASAMMKMSVECFFCGLSTITMITNRFQKKLSKTRQVEKLGDILSLYMYILTNYEEVNAHTSALGWCQVHAGGSEVI